MTDNSNIILHGDCLDILCSIKDGCADLVFIDPPFNLKKIYLGSYGDNLSDADYIDWQHKVIKESFRILKDTGNLIYHNIPRWAYKMATYSDLFGVFQNWIVWDSPGSMPTPSRLYPKHYSFLWFSKTTNKTFNKLHHQVKLCRNCGATIKDYGGKYKYLKEIDGNKVTVLSDIWADIHRIKHNKNKHRKSNELPPQIMDRFVKMLTNERDIVIDPFMGSGTTGVSCKKLGRRFIGIDNIREYCEIAIKRINQTQGNAQE